MSVNRKKRMENNSLKLGKWQSPFTSLSRGLIGMNWIQLEDAHILSFVGTGLQLRTSK